MPSSASYTESQTGSQSSRGPHITQWLPQLVFAALFSLAVASIIGVSLSAVAFSKTEGLEKPGHGIAQSFVMFAVSSLFSSRDVIIMLQRRLCCWLTVRVSLSSL
jgi:hypothetical protein